ncbi:alpha-ketoglutarate-dependent dioxygenase AlkB [Nostoc sp. FACHB-888]|uniref:alpha-ketoglutarate-dependent dioxygenase AlkB family protein n=1 Tax=Nostoc sp. FACHB-888 TaxID=2692842 RepID=UPI001683D385|nr:alpha-ketoglutarate-dependent dioxygenase AlkB [Nostoc sp. FACHB-888]MBD2243009.1 alpha-ketoglutarate-dependent dioxygenase AlkB [Nostoc sp. FACHB-888]MCC5654780.1 alpha-ketoglutarate-dependent dioxygenase AlkB [Nostoc sp. XA013]
MKYDTDNQLSLNLWQQSAHSSHLQIDHLSVPDAEITYYPSYFTVEESDEILQRLFIEVNWQQDKIKCYGKEINLPRLTAWYGDTGKCYTYSKIKMNPMPWTPVLLLIKKRVEDIAEFSFNSVLLNLYRDGKDSVSWHSDDEPELGKYPVIYSVSFGGERKFQLRHKFDKKLKKVELVLTHGSLLIMKGKTQEYWQHQIPKTSKPVMPRINLTFRIIKCLT